MEAVDWSEVFVTHKKVGGNGGQVKCGNTVTVLRPKQQILALDKGAKQA